MPSRKKWKPQEKAKIVLQALQGRPISEICLEHSISNSMLYKWKDQFFANMHLAYEAKQSNKEIQKVQNQNKKLKAIVADLTLELKKTDW